MSSTKIIIICLLLLMAIFFIGLSLNLIEKDNQGLENASKADQKKAAVNYNKDSWLKSVNGLLSPFAETIPAKGRKLKNCSSSKNGFVLNQQQPLCKIEITGFDDKAFKKLSLKPSSNIPTAKLEIHYKEKGKSAEDPSYWPAKDQDNGLISFVIMGSKEYQGQTAVTITLKCLNDCKNQQKINFVFE